MASVTSVNSSQAAVALAQRRVEQDQSQVQRYNERLEQSRAQLSKDQEQLSQAQEQSRRAELPPLQAAAASPRPTPAVESPGFSQQFLLSVLPRPQLNGFGQTIGSLINVTA